MVFNKDYKNLYAAAKLDLKDQVSLTTRLETEIKRLNDELFRLKTGDAIGLRERIAALYGGIIPFRPESANAMYNWITGDTAKVEHKENALGYTIDPRTPMTKPKRKYTKKSKRWKKKKSVKKTS